MVQDALSSQKKSEFLNENENIKEVTEEGVHPLLDEINSDDEVWIVQCPKNINVNQLEESPIKLPGRTNLNQIETVAEEFVLEKNMSIAFNSTGTTYKMKSLPVKGRLVVRKKLQQTEIDTKEIVDNSVKAAPFPTNLKVRHPLLGADYERKINLSDEVRKKLKRAEKASKKSKHKSRDGVKDEPQDDVEFISQEIISPNQRKRKSKVGNDHEDSVDSPSKKKKHKKIKQEPIEDDDVSKDLAWIKAL